MLDACGVPVPIAYVIPAPGKVDVIVTVAVCVAQSVAETVATTAGNVATGVTVTLPKTVHVPDEIVITYGVADAATFVKILDACGVPVPIA